MSQLDPEPIIKEITKEIEAAYKRYEIEVE